MADGQGLLGHNLLLKDKEELVAEVLRVSSKNAHLKEENERVRREVVRLHFQLIKSDEREKKLTEEVQQLKARVEALERERDSGEASLSAALSKKGTTR